MSSISGVNFRMNAFVSRNSLVPNGYKALLAIKLNTIISIYYRGMSILYYTTVHHCRRIAQDMKKQHRVWSCLGELQQQHQRQSNRPGAALETLEIKNRKIKDRVERFHFLNTLKDLRLREENYMLERLFCSHTEAQRRKKNKRHGHCKCTAKRRRQINGLKINANICRFLLSACTVFFLKPLVF